MAAVATLAAWLHRRGPGVAYRYCPEAKSRVLASVRRKGIQVLWRWEEGKDGVPHLNLALGGVWGEDAAAGEWRTVRKALRALLRSSSVKTAAGKSVQVFGRVVDVCKEPILPGTESARNLADYWSKTIQAPRHAPVKFQAIGGSRGLLPPLRPRASRKGPLAGPPSNSGRESSKGSSVRPVPVPPSFGGGK